MNFFGIGGLEVVVIAALAFFLLGPKKMIETSRSAGKLIRELKVERDKFTNMVMTEFDTEDDKPAAGSQRTATPSAEASEASPDDPPDGAVSRPRGPGRNIADFGDPGGPDAPDEPDPEDVQDRDDPASPSGGTA